MKLGRDALDATMNYGAHSKFVARWLEKLEAEDTAISTTVPTVTSTAEEPQAAATPPTAAEPTKTTE